jgi:hypothetical protein
MRRQAFGAEEKRRSTSNSNHGQQQHAATWALKYGGDEHVPCVVSSILFLHHPITLNQVAIMSNSTQQICVLVQVTA